MHLISQNNELNQLAISMTTSNQNDINQPALIQQPHNEQEVRSPDVPHRIQTIASESSEPKEVSREAFRKQLDRISKRFDKYQSSSNLNDFTINELRYLAQTLNITYDDAQQGHN